ncbi:MAG: NAD(P)/FAD-dependent oxidoreductase [Rhodothermia bacterium]|nr:MAG: NAD(P)/FAD-dependent oxidoreductase [Rhodothermia bacterium]
MKRASVRIILLDKENFHLFQPLLYQVATAALNPSDIAYPLRAALRRQNNVTVLLGQAEAIHLREKKIGLANGELAYDYLLLATGATHSYFGNNQWAAYAPGLKTIADALEIRRRIFLAYEAAERESDEQKRQEWLTFTVIGGGPTGVELAGALAEIGFQTLAKEFRRIDPGQIRVILVEGKDRILSSYSPDMSRKAERQLEKLGVEVWTDSLVSELTESSVVLGESSIPSRTILWAAGVEASPLARSLNVELDHAGRVRVEDDLSVPGYKNVFVAGDLARVEFGEGNVPGIAPAAIQEGVHAAMNITQLARNQPTRPFTYKDKGTLATIGRAAAVAQFKKVRFSGFLAWIAWLAIHIFFLIGFRNRLWVLSGWAWSYVTFQRGVRLITGRHRYQALPELSDENR